MKIRCKKNRCSRPKIIRVSLQIVIILLSIMYYGCTKEGPMGPAGPPGTADVVYSEWAPFSMVAWTLKDEFGKAVQQYPIYVPSLDTNIVNHGVVLMYVKFGGLPDPTPLPVTIYESIRGIHQQLTFRFVVDTLKVIYFDLDDNLDPGPIGFSNLYRYVIIPGGVKVDSNAAPINYTDYEAVREYYHIED